MHKIISFFALVGTAFTTLVAQNETQKQTPKIELGITSKKNRVQFIEGIAPAGFEMDNNTLGLNVSGTLNIPIHSNFDLVSGLTYNIDRYKSSLGLDYQVNRLGYYSIWRVQTIEYFTPTLGLDYHFPGEKNPFSLVVLGCYKWTNAPFLSRFTEDYFVDGFNKPVTIRREAKTQPINHSKFGFQMQTRYQFLDKGNLNSTIALVYQYAKPTSRVEEFVGLNDRNYQFTYDRKASFWGLSLFFGYQKVENQ
jgi:hypothetical protein